MAKKFYWLKLNEDFFRQPRIKKLRRIAGGDTYTIIYLKMQLLSLENEGKLYFEGIEETFAEELALIIDEDPENVKVTLLFLFDQGLIEECDGNEYLMIETAQSIDGESDSAARVRKHRLKSKQSKTNKQVEKALPCNGDVTPCNADVTECNDASKKCNVEIEIEIEKEIEIEREIEKEIEIESDIQRDITPLTPLMEGGRDSASSEENLKPKKKPEKASATDQELMDRFGPYLSDAVRDWINYKKERRETYKPVGLRNLLSQVEHQANEHGKQAVIDVIRLSMSNGWKGIIWDRIPKAEPRGISNPFLDPDL